MSDFLNSLSLNDPQLDAVSTTEGPLLVLAGAGTGKTRVLTSRIGHLINSGKARPWEILAVTFTNKAAKEMQFRIAELIENAGSVNAGTFHSISARILRQYANLVGLTSSFTIIDQDDQLKIVKNIIDELLLNKKDNAPKTILHLISRWKDMGLKYSQISKSDLISPDHHTAKIVYEKYQNKLNSSNLCDFGDLLLYNTTIFFDHPDVLEKLQQQYKYILIDEYQDTNAVQYLWARMLASYHKNICCVGDDDQSIYSWRGAEIANILRFGKDFENAKIIALEQNYRSTHHILNSASSLIQNNPTRHKKKLWTAGEKGSPINIVSCYNEKEEATFIANYIKQATLSGDLKLQDIAILVRAGFQTRAFEESFITTNINYKIIGGLKFYERMEIKDAIAYLRLIINKQDDVAFERIINVPKRAIGPSTLTTIKEYANINGVSYFESIKRLIVEGSFKNKLYENISAFIRLIENYTDRLTMEHVPSDIIKNLIGDNGYRDMLKLEKTDESRARLDNLNELIRAMAEYDSILNFIEHASLVMDNDNASDGINHVSVMTIHSAKGLEFDTVFIPGMEEGLFPHQKSITEEGIKGIEEERRLAYVAITRAKKTLFLLHAMSRRIFHEFVQSTPSRFIAELPPESFVKISSTQFFTPKFFKDDRKAFNSKSSGFNSFSSNSFGNKPFNQVQKIVESKSLIEEGIRPGSRVRHNSFGDGIIIKKNSDNLEIFFDSSGIKTIKESFVSLI